PLAQAGDQRGAWAGAEEMLDGRLAEMAEGRIADVMPDAGRGDDMAELGRAQPRQIAAMPLHDRLADLGAQRAADRGNLKRMRQPVAHIVALRQRMDLGLVLQAAEGRTEDDAIPVLLEGIARRRHRLGTLVPEPLG